MHNMVMEYAGQCDVFIATAAVSDYRPTEAMPHKIKKDSECLNLKLIKNPDILADVAQHYRQVFTVGFAAETHNLEQYAKAKLQNKGINMIAANWVGEGELGFESDENALTVFWSNGHTEFKRTRKATLATKLIHLIAKKLHD